MTVDTLITDTVSECQRSVLPAGAGKDATELGRGLLYELRKQRQEHNTLNQLCHPGGFIAGEPRRRRGAESRRGLRSVPPPRADAA